VGLISIDGTILKKMFIGGANEVTNCTPELNALNVFPVPDGDTGTNMGYTARAAVLETMKLSSPNISDIAKAASNGALRGARGNSGVIMSQLFRGFSKGLEGKAVASARDLGRALVSASEMAYKAVMKPKEGTMLTIGRSISESASESAENTGNIEECLARIIRAADDTLQKTPSMLPVLKEAGVVDAGGMGVICFFKGALKALETAGDIELITQAAESQLNPAAMMNTEDIKFVYCTEFLIEVTEQKGRKPMGSPDPEQFLREFLPTIGDSVVVIEDEGLIKVHVHTNNPGKALEKALTFGQLLNIKIENMKAQHTELIEFSTSVMPKKSVGLVTVAAGKGISDLLKNLGVDLIIEGGQSMNPSAMEIAEAIEKVNSDLVIVLPNNKNIILTAEQAAKLVSGKDVRVMPTRSIPQGIACVISNSDTISIADNLENMTEAMEAVHSGQITRAVRDTVLDGHNIKEGDFLCIYDGDITIVEKDLTQAAFVLAEYMLDKGGELVSIYYGEDATEEFANEIANHIAEKYPMAEIDIINGGQPLYNIIMSVE